MRTLDRFRWNGDQKALEADDKGLVFRHPRYGHIADFDEQGFQIVGTYVDTFRQLFRGRMNPNFHTDIEHSLDLKEKKFQLLGQNWILAKIGKNSGYQYRLQNSQIGLVILFKQFHAKAESPASHLKIECSPWFLDNRKPKEVDDYLKRLADRILVGAEAYYPAIHLAVDIQGWEPAQDFAHRMHSKSKKCSQYNGLEITEFNLHEITGVYEKGQSFCFGSANASQLAVYNKTLQAKKIDKFDYMEHKWRNSTLLDDGSSGYDPDRDVFRIETRFHHSVIQQFALGSCDIKTGEIGVRMNTYSEVLKHIHSLWQYGLKSFQFKYNRNYLDPLWTILKDDVVFKYPESSYKDNLHYKRYYKKATSFTGKNYQLMMGNFLSACARESVPFDTVLHELQSMTIWNSITLHYEDKETTEHQLIDRLRDSYTERELLGYGI
ncbi:hypothetical protein EOPP23_06375 [Endozoicomonas sp. OPT23]|uniref:hypothetical protein n=1 Tax=Endozoicomonas sp. OPT23 TaxID=2072845 RepID=UPI00129BBAE3|nr:hypothetical protein [Endozoicomonas sp. OPT23]MRI32612.1 hypothetical protein [Endozoicomonas sp. OPT23]